MGSLTGKTALVTGASRGIGRAIAHRLAQDGALVAVHYGENGTAAREAVERIEEEGGRAFAVQARLGAPGDAETLFAGFDAALEAIGEPVALDILVNNAATSRSGPIEKLTSETYERIFAVNVKAPLFLAQLGLTRMRDGGRIVNVSSAATRVAFPESIAYAMSKGAIDTLSLALAKAVGPRRITVNAVAPGFIATDMNAERRANPEGAALLAAASVFQRIGEPADVADMVAFLASDDSRWITGQYIDVSGGTNL
ncbi:SDR family NAD(P)-dependent oxidoreductase [Streptomyces sp. NPDC057638]|uniref:SDR family NAD(P)-dependent oxidoreductase n=1 Tax=Streptomyces sp. NPDC057638 TaxID=3346190 RepID=UPI0036C84771